VLHKKKWVFPDENPAAVERLTSALRICAVTARLLVNRGFTEPTSAQQFLQPSLQELTDPTSDPRMRQAARFALDAARAGKRIAVFGDYDADGICAAALLMRAFNFLDADAHFYIPHRINEGYGLSAEALEELADAGAQLVITVDCGISAIREVAFARKRGIDVIITDHHEPGDTLPEATYLLNPKLDACSFGYKNLAGVGVAFKLVWSMGQQISDSQRVSSQFKDLLMEALSLVAIGAVADVVPLRDENRILVHYGLKTARAANRPGLSALLNAARVDAQYLNATDIAFRVAPLLNAAGRMGKADAAVELLTTSDPGEAERLADLLVKQNRLRRRVQSKTLEQARTLLAQRDPLLERNCIVLAAPDWHQGVVGLVASRLAEKFLRPAFVFTTDGEMARGSARSIEGFPLFAAVQRCADLLLRYGGHQGAAGLSLPLKNLPQFEERINAVAAELLAEERPEPELNLDGEFQLDHLNLALMRELGALGPFGKGNPEPMFAAAGLRMVGNARILGADGRHLAFMARQGDAALRVFAPGKADWIEPLRDRKGDTFSLAFQPQINRYRGQVNVELRACDLLWTEERQKNEG